MESSWNQGSAVWVATPSVVDGETVWKWFAFAFAAYWTVFIAGAYTNRPDLNNVGAVFILAALGWATLERLWVQVDSVFAVCLVACVIPLLVMFLTGGARYPDAIVKHLSLYVVMALSRLLRLPPVSGSRMRVFLGVQVLIVLVLSSVTDRAGVWDGGTRHSGLFANPNNLALIPFLLLFFVDRRRDPLWVHLGAHAIVVAVLALSGTSGAVVAYGIGLAIHFSSLLRQPARSIAYGCGALGALLLVVLIATGAEKLLPETRLTNQIAVMRSQFDTVMAGQQVEYYEQEKVLGSGSASAIWRLAHWRRTIVTWANGTVGQHLVGFGIGSSPGILGKLPHNEYLRILFEQGLVGFVLFLFAWSRIIGRAPRDVRYVGLIFAMYSFSENNLDNFPFMSLFILCLSATERL